MNFYFILMCGTTRV